MSKNRFVEQGKASKPETMINPAETAAQETAARKGIAAAAGAVATAETAAAAETVKTEFESAMSKVGFKSVSEMTDHALATAEVAIAKVKSAAIAKFFAMDGFVYGGGVVGIDTADLTNVIFSFNRAAVLAAAAAKVSAPKSTAANAGFRKREIYDDNAGDGVNRVMLGEINRNTGDGYMAVKTAAAELLIAVATADSELLTGKKPVNNKARDYVFAVVTVADKTEMLVSAWLPGLMNMVKARKSAITNAASPAQLQETIIALKSGNSAAAATETDELSETDATAETAAAE